MTMSIKTSNTRKSRKDCRNCLGVPGGCPTHAAQRAVKRAREKLLRPIRTANKLAKVAERIEKARDIEEFEAAYNAKMSDEQDVDPTHFARLAEDAAKAAAELEPKLAEAKAKADEASAKAEPARRALRLANAEKTGAFVFG
jgi:hypothetical protein